MKRWSKHHSQSRGFTLLELLIVIAIIGILSSIVLFATNRTRINSRNAAVIEQVQEYQKALEIYFAQNDSYPSPGTTNTALMRKRIYCIGNGFPGFPSGSPSCVSNAQTQNVSSQVETMLIPNYINNIVYIPIPGSANNRGSPGYRGCSDICSGTSNCPGTASTSQNCSDQDYSLFYMLEGLSQDCGPGIFVSGDVDSKYTMCQISSSQ